MLLDYWTRLPAVATTKTQIKRKKDGKSGKKKTRTTDSMTYLLKAELIFKA